MTGTPVPVSVVIAAHNEERQIGACVRSVSWAAEVLVVENDSTDDTLAQARAAGASAFSHPFTSIGRQRNAAIERASREWVLVLDADERASPALGEEVRRRVGEPAAPQAYRIRRHNVFLGRDIRHGGWQNDQPVRLFRRDLRYDDSAVHEHVVTTGRVDVLDAALRHEPYATLDEYFAKLARYSHDWARQHYARGRRASPWMLVAKPPARFVSMYVFRGGWRDGAQGVLLAVLAAVSVASKYAHLWALVRQEPGDRWAPS
jgi:glycosyltransferase involved in cell wall biosynthesis